MFVSKHFLKIRCSQYLTFDKNMSKKAKAKSKTPATSECDNNKGPIKVDKDGHILIGIYAKPGAKQNAITDISEDGVNIQINAPPVEGSANTELMKYMASFLGLKSSNVSLEKGHKSRNKVLKISGNIEVTEVIKRINAEVPDHSKLPEGRY